MACGCKKKKKVPATPAPQQAPFTMSSVAVVDTNDVVLARCTNCTGLLLTYDNRYIPFNTGESYQVVRADVTKWRLQGWLVEVIENDDSSSV